MKTLVCIKPGELEYSDIRKPTLQNSHALLKVRRIGICGTDLHAYTGTQPYFSYPRILGHELAADLVDIDANNSDDFTPGEPITFIPYFNCGKCIACRNGKPNCCVEIKVCGVHVDGGMAEFLSVPSHTLVHGNGLSYDALALAEPLSIGAHGVRRAGVRHNEFVLIMGAGPIGLGTMEFARIAGAQVIALDINEARLQFCKEKLKIDHTINAAIENVTQKLLQITNGDMPTVVIDATGNQKAINSGLQYLAHGGRYILIGLQKNELVFSHPEFHKKETTLMSSRNATRQDFEHVISSMKKGIINATIYITHRTQFGHVKDEFEKWLNPANGVIKAMVEIN